LYIPSLIKIDLAIQKWIEGNIQAAWRSHKPTLGTWAKNINIHAHDKEEPVLELTVIDCFANIKYRTGITDKKLPSNGMSSEAAHLVERQSIFGVLLR
jgi:hypothetical protein